MACRGADFQGFGVGGGEVFLLADVGHEADNFIVLLEEPGKDAGGVEAAGVGEAYFGSGHCYRENVRCNEENRPIGRTDVRGVVFTYGFLSIGLIK